MRSGDGGPNKPRLSGGRWASASSGRGEDEVLLHRAPHGALIRRQIAQRHRGVQQHGIRRAHFRSVAPPVVDQHVERREPFDVVPPAKGTNNASPDPSHRRA